jgi:alpha-tubulin suppressor-like RCC1 family protein
MPSQIGTNSDWSVLAAGGNYSLSIKTTRTLWTWGLNTNGQLGDGTTDMWTWTPRQIGTNSDWSKISAGSAHIIAIKTQGTLWTWGKNDFGQLGIGNSYVNRNTPTQVTTETDWSIISAGNAHSLGLKSNGTLWAWGRNDLGQLGDGSTTQRNTPMQIGTDTNWLKVAAGNCYAISLKTNGTLWGWGNNQYGQLGLGATWTEFYNEDEDYYYWGWLTENKNAPTQTGTNSDWFNITTGDSHVFAIKTNGTLWAWGYNFSGQLGDSTQSNRYTPRLIGSVSDWSLITAGGYYTLGLKTNRTMWAWGYNGYGQLGLGDNTNKNTPTLIGE